MADALTDPWFDPRSTERGRAAMEPPADSSWIEFESVGTRPTVLLYIRTAISLACSLVGLVCSLVALAR